MFRRDEEKMEKRENRIEMRRGKKEVFGGDRGRKT